jgi:Bacterial regulatory helix-turn-helix protein, lysR family.
MSKRTSVRSSVPTEREIQVLSAITRHGTIRAAALALGVSRHTVDATLDLLRERSGFHFLPQILAWATTHGWLEFRLSDFRSLDGVQEHRIGGSPGTKVLARTASGSPVPRLSGRVRRSQEQ